MLHVPEASEFPGTGPDGNGISPEMKSQAQFLRNLKSGECWACHQLGNKATREFPEGLGTFDSPVAAWHRRLQSGQAGGNMMSGLETLGSKRALAMFADWTSRIEAGELPPAPPRPQGMERNVVITQWDWADPESVPARRGLDGQTQPDAERERSHLRSARAQRRLPSGSGPGAPYHRPGEADGARSRDTADLGQDAGAVPLLERGRSLDEQEQRA